MAMQLRRVSGCCCGCSLRTGALAFATVYLILNAFAVLAFKDHLAANGVEDRPHFLYDDRCTQPGAYTGIASSLLNIIFNALLIYALVKKNPVLLRVWIIFEWCMIAFAVASIVLIVVLWTTLGFHPTAALWIMLFLLIIVIFSIALPYYSILVVNSYYHVLREEEKGKEEGNLLRAPEKCQMNC